MASDPLQLLVAQGGGNPYLASVQGQQGLQAGQQQLDIGALQLKAAQDQQQQAQSYQQDVESYFKDPAPARLAGLIAKYPQQADALKQSKAALDEPARQSQLTQYGQLYNAASAGRTDLLIKQATALKTAEAAQGVDTSEIDDVLGRLQSSDPAAQKEATKQILALSQVHIAALDPKFAENIQKVAQAKGNDTHVINQGGSLVDDSGAELYHNSATKTEYRTVKNADGSESIIQLGGGGQASGGSEPATGSARWSSSKLAEAVPFGGTVTSGVRTPAHNAAVGGVPNSQHVAGTAIDVVFPKGVTTDQVREYYAQKGAAVQVIHENVGDPHSTGDHFHIQAAGTSPATGQARFNSDGSKVIFTSRGNPGGARGNAPSGYRFKGDGTLEAIPGGPADSEKLDDATVSTMAEQYLAGDKTVLQNLGRGAQGGAAVARVRQEIARQAKAVGMSGRDIAAQMADFTGVVASERATGTRTAQVELAATEAQKLAPLALAASDALPRAGWVPFARAEQMIRSGTNNTALRRFVTANQGLVNTYARAVSPTGVPTVDSQAHARAMLDTAYDQDSYRATVDQMMKEIAAARAAPRAVRNDLRQNVGGNYQPGAAPPPPAALNYLRANPGTRAQFDAKYGAGASARAMGR